MNFWQAKWIGIRRLFVIHTIKIIAVTALKITIHGYFKIHKKWNKLLFTFLVEI